MVSGLLVVTFLVLASGLVGVGSQWVRANWQRNLANQERDNANRNLYDALVREARGTAWLG